jgi:hypothetical protein
MLLNKVLDENAIVSESIEDFDITDFIDAYSECAVSIEQTYGEFMLEQAKDEFKQYVNEGVITESIDAIKEKAKKLVEKIKEIIIRLRDKVLKVLEDYRFRSITYFNKNKEAIEKGVNLVDNFMGYEVYKDFEKMKKPIMDYLILCGNMKKEVERATSKDEISKAMGNLNRLPDFLITVKDPKDFVKENYRKTNIKYTFNELEKVFKDKSEYENYNSYINDSIKCCDDIINQINSINTDDELGAYKNKCYIKLANFVSKFSKECSKASLKVFSQGFKYMKAAVSAASNA